jgi:hypothetical protein
VKLNFANIEKATWVEILVDEPRALLRDCDLIIAVSAQEMELSFLMGLRLLVALGFAAVCEPFVSVTLCIPGPAVRHFDRILDVLVTAIIK